MKRFLDSVLPGHLLIFTVDSFATSFYVTDFNYDLVDVDLSLSLFVSAARSLFVLMINEISFLLVYLNSLFDFLMNGHTLRPLIPVHTRFNFELSLAVLAKRDVTRGSV